MSTLIVTGRLGKDAELRETQGGTKVVAFSIADDVGWGDKKRTQWIKCAFFGDRAAKVHQYLTKGSMVEIVGTPSVSLWADKQTKEPRGNIEVTVSDLRLHGGGKTDEQAAPRARTPGNSRSQVDDDIPF